MSIFEYNLRTILGTIIIIIFIFVTAIIFVSQGKDFEWFKRHIILYKRITFLLSITLSLIILFTCFFSIARKSDNMKKVVVNDIVCVGGFGGFTFFDTYTIYCIDENGKEINVRVSIYSSNKFKEKISLIEKGDNLYITYTSGLNFIYYFSST